MEAGDFARTNDILQDTVGLKHDMLAIGDLYLAPYDRIDEGQFGEATVEEVRQRLEDLREGGFLDEHRVEDAVRGIGLGVLADTAARERSVTDIHREELIIDRFFAIHRQHHMLRLMLDDRADEAEDIVDVVRTDIVLERLGFLAAQRVYAETDGVDEIAVVLDVIAPIGEATDVDRMSFALEEATKRLFMVLGEVPEPSPVITRASRHEPHLYLRFLLRSERRTHDAVDGFGERAVATEDEYLVISFLDQFAR